MMKVSWHLQIAVAAACVVLVHGSLLEDINGLPTCGVNCIASSVEIITCPDLTNTTCLCADERFVKSVQTCLEASCSPVATLEVLKFQAKECDMPQRSRKGALIKTLAIEIPALLFPWMRLYSRWIMGNDLALDDYLMLLCDLLFAAFLALGQYVSFIAFGRDIWEVAPESITLALKLFYIDETFYLICLGLSKIAVLSFYLRIFPNKTFQNLAKGTIVFIIVSTVLFTLLQIFQCHPISFIWEGWKDPSQPHRCINVNTLVYGAAGVNIFQDIIILILPLPLLVKLNTILRTKLGIILMFSLGIFVLVTSVMRLQYLVSFRASSNPTWDYTDPILWSGLEVSMSIIVACLPAIRVLFKNPFPRHIKAFFSWNSHSGNYGRKYSTRSGGGSGHLRTGLARRRPSISNNIFPSQRNQAEANESQVELGFELGDKTHGVVQTDILAENEVSVPRQQGSRSRSRSSTNGIYVITTTTTTRVIGENDWPELESRGGSGSEVSRGSPQGSLTAAEARDELGG